MRNMVLRLAFAGGLSGDFRPNGSLPAGWRSDTVDSIAVAITPGFACSRDKQAEGGHVHLRTHNISTLGTLNFDLLVRIAPVMVDSHKSSLRKGDVLFNNTNSQELVGKTALVDRDYDYAFSNHITRIRPGDQVVPAYLTYYLTFLQNSGHFSRLCTRWINQAAINTDTLREQVIPLPPLAEQKRIVAKVDELMALCDRLEAQQQQREQAHADLNHAALARFANAPTVQNLEYLFRDGCEASPESLRESILRLAVQGQLVLQNSSEEPASAALRRIAEAKARVDRGRRGRDTSESEIVPSPPSVIIPEGWAMAPLADLVDVLNGRAYAKDELLAEGTPVLRVGNLFTSKHWYYSNLPLEPDKYCDSGDLLYAWSASFGPFVWPGPRVIYHYHIWKLRLHSEADLNKQFLYWFLQEKTAELRSQGHGVSMIHMTKQKMEKVQVPVPPLDEQRRIVAKVNELMALVDRLESNLASAQVAGEKLMDAVVAELTTVATVESAVVTTHANAWSDHQAAALECVALLRHPAERRPGRLGAYKSAYLAAACCHRRLASPVLKHRLGPFNAEAQSRYESIAHQEQWFSTTELPGRQRVRYTNGAKSGDAIAIAKEACGEAWLLIDRLFGVLKNCSESDLELFATVHACWNRRVQDNKPIDADSLFVDVREWSIEKQKYSRSDVSRAMSWLKANDLIPNGGPPFIEVDGSLF